MNEVKGGLFINQMKRYAKRFSDHTKNSVSISVNLWFFPEFDHEDQYRIEFKLWDSSKSKHYIPFGKHNDFRKLGALINQIIKDEKEGG